MLLVYENRTDGIVAEWKKPVHLPPHLHEAIEVVYVTDGDIVVLCQGAREIISVNSTL